MAVTHVMQSTGGRFPAGTVVGVYAYGVFTSAGTAPAGATITTATVSATGTVTFEGLAGATAYWAAQLQNSTWVKTLFATREEEENRGFGTINAKGDLLVGSDDDTVARLAVGADGQVLTAAADAPEGVRWSAASAGIPVGTLDAKGDLIAATAADTPARVAVGADGQMLIANAASAAGVAWAWPENAISEELIDAKGDLVVGTAGNTAGRLAVGSNNQILTADSAQAGGMKWAAIPSPTAGTLAPQVFDLGTISTTTAQTVDLQSTYYDVVVAVTLGANVTLNFTNVPSRARLSIRAVQGASNYTLTLQRAGVTTDVDWDAGTAHVMSSAAGAIDRIAGEATSSRLELGTVGKAFA